MKISKLFVIRPLSLLLGVLICTATTLGVVSALNSDKQRVNNYLVAPNLSSNLTINYDTNSINLDKKVPQKQPVITHVINGESQKVTTNKTFQLNDYNFDTYVDINPTATTGVAPLFYDIADGYNLQSKDMAGIAKKYTDGSERYMCITLPIKTPINLEDIVVKGARNEQFALGAFEVYASEKEEELFNNESLISTIDNHTQKKNLFNFHYGTENSIQNIQFVGLKIIDMLADWDKIVWLVEEQGIQALFPRMGEFTVYGTLIDPNFEEIPVINTKGYDFAKLYQEKGESIIAKSNPAARLNSKSVQINGETIKKLKKIYSNPPDPETNKHVDLDISGWKEGSTYIDFQFRITSGYELTQVDGFAFQGIYNDNEIYFTSHYQVYVAEEIEDLYLPQSMVFEFSAEEYGNMKGQVVEFPEGMQPRGCYIAFRIIDACYSATENTNPRFSVLYFWGKEAKVDAFPTNLAENMPVDSYYDCGNKNTSISDSDFTVKELSNLTDEDDSTSATFNTAKHKKDKLNLVYNLCGGMKVDEIAIIANINSNSGFKTMKVYAASTRQEVGNKNALFWTYKPNEAGGMVSPSKKFSKAKQMRYVRFEFDGLKSSLTLNMINIEGLDNQKMKTKSLTATLSAESVIVKSRILKNDIVKEVAYDDASLECLFDGDKKTYTEIAVDSGVVGKNNYEILIKLGDLRTISSLEFTFLKNYPQLTPKKFYIYLGETENSVSTAKREDAQCVVTSKECAKGYVNLSFKPTLARFIRIEFTEFNKVDGFQLADGGYRISSSISELSIRGTNVKGLQSSEDSEVLTNFMDEKTGVGINIIRLDANDIYDTVSSIKVTKQKATNSQMLSLQQVPFCKVVDKSIYKIELLDMYGKIVDDLDGRLVQIVFKTPTGVTKDKLMIGNATHKGEIVAYDTSIDKSVVNTGKIDWSGESNDTFALLCLTTSSDKYWSTIGEPDYVEESTDDEEYVDPEWYNTIRTTDGMFEVTGVDAEIDEDVRFTAKEISAIVSDDEYRLVLESFEGMQVAAFYDLSFTLNEQPYIYGGYVDIMFNMPEYITNRFTDLHVVHVSDFGDVTEVYSETTDDGLYFQCDSFSHYAIIGTVIEGAPNYSENTEIVGGTPDTGDNLIVPIVVLLGMTAAAFVVYKSRSSIKRTK